MIKANSNRFGELLRDLIIFGSLIFTPFVTSICGTGYGSFGIKTLLKLLEFHCNFKNLIEICMTYFWAAVFLAMAFPSPFMGFVYIL